jgi:predicted ATPase/class 3 adenylate cyclase/DNA-binding XRE family transcriptional regulator
MVEDVYSFGDWVRLRRQSLVLSREDLARQVGVAEVSIRKIEADERRPSSQVAALLAQQLQLAAEAHTLFVQVARGLLAVGHLPPPIPGATVSAPSALAVSASSAALLPSGTVTFLFTDIVGSTQLWEQHPRAMQQALVRHDALLRASIAAHSGVVVKSTGDGLLAAFARATNAAYAALAAQRSLAVEAWGTIGALQVRMALHTGVAEERDGDYFGPSLNRVARLLSAGHGGQILLSLATAELVREQLPPDADLRDLGAQRLKDLSRPEQIFQLITPDLPSDFPPLHTLDARRTNLPAQPTLLIGREQEVATICALLCRPEVRLLTLTGPGGTGKTRLGLQVAAELALTPNPAPIAMGEESKMSTPPRLPQRERRAGGEGHFPDGVYFVNLVPIRDPNLVTSAVAQTLGVIETGDQPLAERLQSYLRHKQLLLLLDNFEQIVDAAALVAELLAGCPQLTILVTSRVPLHLRGEKEVSVPPLALPDLHQLPAVESLTQYAAVELFIQRALDVQPDFAVTNDNAPAVAEICYRLDGLPLAIELAAARLKLFTPEALLARLSSRLTLLTGGARDLPARQQTLRSAIAWSYDLMDEGALTLFRRLAVFVGGCTIEAAEAVCSATGDLPFDGLDGLALLVDNSLLKREQGADGEPRFRMLETIREYALERLEGSGELDAVQRRHAEYFLRLAEEAQPQLDGPDQAAWLERLEGEHDNMRMALAWSQGPMDSAETGLRLAAALAGFWWMRGYLRQGRAWLVAALAQPGAAAPSLARARALGLAGWWASVQGDDSAVHACYDECLALYRALGDRRGSAETLAGLGVIACAQGDYAHAAVLCEESLALYRELGDQSGCAHVLSWVGAIARDQGDYVRAMPLFAESLAIWRDLGDKSAVADVLNGMGDAMRQQGDYIQAAALYQEALALAQEAGDMFRSALARSNLGRVVHAEGDDAQAVALLEESVAWFRDVGHTWGLMWALHHLSAVAYAQGDDVRARALLREGLRLQQQLGQKRLITGSLERFAGLAARQGQPARATRRFGAAAALRTALGSPLPPGERADYDRDVASAHGQLDAASFAAAWAEGQALTLKQAIAEVLSEGD